MENKAMEHYLTDALKNEEFDILFQPVLDFYTGNIIKVESLIRWNSDILGNVSPDTFIATAEKCGLIYLINEWVYCESLRRIRNLQLITNINIGISLNVSPLEINNSTIVKTLKKAISCSGINPHCINLEITEGILLEDSITVLKTIEKIQQMGVRISIDDFGTGFSSLSYLTRFRVDCIKIDKHFVEKVHRNSQHLIIVKILIRLSKYLNIKTVAEGVETHEQYKLLKELGCDMLQGYYMHKPMNLMELITVVNNSVLLC